MRDISTPTQKTKIYSKTCTFAASLNIETGILVMLIISPIFYGLLKYTHL